MRINDVVKELKETKVIDVYIDVDCGYFIDDKEIAELFKYVYEQSPLYIVHNFENTFGMAIYYGTRAGKFTLRLNEDQSCYYDERKNDVIHLIEDYKREEEIYLKFKKFGDIESRAMIRRKS